MLTVLSNEGKARLCSTVTECANGVAGDIRPNLSQKVEFFNRPPALAHLDQNAIDPATPFAARSTLAAGLMLVKSHQVVKRQDRIDSVTQHDGTTGPEHAADRTIRVDSQGQVQNTLAVVLLEARIVRQIDYFLGQVNRA